MIITLNVNHEWNYANAFLAAYSSFHWLLSQDQMLYTLDIICYVHFRYFQYLGLFDLQ